MNTARPLSVAVAVPTYLRDGVLVETLAQVLGLSPRPDEVLVIDQTPQHDPATESWLAQQSAAGRIRWIRQAPPNLPKARNRALAETRCEILVFIDDDVVLHEGFLEAHAANYRDDRVHAVAGRVVQRKGWKTPRRSRPWPRSLDYVYFRLDGTTRVEDFGNFCGCNHSVRCEAARAMGGYDEAYVGWAFREDTDAAFRIRRNGGRIVFDPGAALTHLAAPAGGCRIDGGSNPMPQWMISFPALYFAFGHLFPGLQFWKECCVLNVRRYVLSRDNLRMPWRVPAALGGYVRAFLEAMVARARSCALRPSPEGALRAPRHCGPEQVNGDRDE